MRFSNWFHDIDHYVAYKYQIEETQMEQRRKIIKSDLDVVRLDYISSGIPKWGVSIDDLREE